MCSLALFSFPIRAAHQLFDEMPQRRKRAGSALKAVNLSRQTDREQVFICEREPPWLVDPPVEQKNPFNGEASVFDFQVKGGGFGIPFSIKLVQLRKKRMNFRRIQCDEWDRGSVGNAVWSLALIMEEIQRNSRFFEGEMGNFDSEDIGDSIVWLFQKVFYSSPELVIGILALMGNFLGVSTVPMLRKGVLNVLESQVVNLPSYVPGSWSDIGVLDENGETRTSLEPVDHKRRRMVYEQLIVAGTRNSLIFSNYAQLLYQYENDLDRAHEYFKLAVMTEPVDAEAMSRYALFLWHGRRELEAAEEMLLQAIQADSENHYHRSNYACFLWKTGGAETCYPLPVADDAS